MKIIIYNDGEFARTEVGDTDLFVTDDVLIHVLNSVDTRRDILSFCNKKSVIIETLGKLENGIYEDYKIPEYNDKLETDGGIGFYEKV